MRKFARFTLSAFALAVVLSACGDSTGPADNLSGVWVGHIAEPEGAVTVTLDLVDRAGAVTGDGVVEAIQDTFSVVIEGDYDSPGFALMFHFPLGAGVDSAQFTGSRVGDEMRGTLLGEPLTVTLSASTQRRK